MNRGVIWVSSEITPKGGSSLVRHYQDCPCPDSSLDSDGLKGQQWYPQSGERRRVRMAGPDAEYENLRSVLLRLLEYCRTHNWAGYDPYDILNSRILKQLPFLDWRLPRLALTQVAKRSPINFRPLLQVPQTENPKATALFLMALLKLSRLGMVSEEPLIRSMVEKLETARSPYGRFHGWGYSFPWQMRVKIAPRGFPNLVCTVFVANALLDAYEHSHLAKCLSMAAEAADFILNELYWTDEGSSSGFSYPLPTMRSHIHNANFLGAALLARVYRQTSDQKLLTPALKVARYSVSKQNDDGSWYYGEWPSQHWIDNFHTGYNLLALRDLDTYLGTSEFDPAIRRGFQFYRGHFFRDDGAPRYFHDRGYPVDVHCVAQSLLTLIGLKNVGGDNVALSRSILHWAMVHLWDARGYFYYQVHPLYTNKISYMRWSQAWMLLALSALLEENER